MDSFEELRGLCFPHVEEDDFSSHELEVIVGHLENPFGILNFVRSLKEGNIFYKLSIMGSAIAKYSFALKILSFALVSNDEDKLKFSDIAVSLNLNLGACFIKDKDYDRVGQLCSAVLHIDTSNVKAYFRRAVAALELNKPSLAFMDLAQALKIDPNNKECQQKLKEVTSLLGWSPTFVEDALAVAREDKIFRDYAHCGKEENDKLEKGKRKRKARQGCDDDRVRRCIGVKDDANIEKNVDGNSLDLEGKVNPKLYAFTVSVVNAYI